VKRLLLIALAACRPAPPSLDSCDDDLAGVWRVDGKDATTPSGEPRRYFVVDLRRAIEIYPMFDDSLLAPSDRKETTATALIVAPAAFDLARDAGFQTRRFMRGNDSCTIRTPARIHDCKADRATLELVPPSPPSDWARCVAAPAAPITWTLVRERD
jgi:hypothetical protein